MLTQFFCASSYFSYTENYRYCNGYFFNNLREKHRRVQPAKALACKQSCVVSPMKNLAPLYCWIR